MSELISIRELPATKHELEDGIDPFSVAVRSIVDAAQHSRNASYRRSVLPYLNLFTRSESRYKNAVRHIKKHDDSTTFLDVHVERSGAEVSSAVIISGIHRVTSHHSHSNRTVDRLIAEGFMVECWQTHESDLGLADLYAHGIQVVREMDSDTPLYTVERAPFLGEKESRLKRIIFDGAITDAILSATYTEVHTGLITRDDMHAMKPVHARVYAA